MFVSCVPPTGRVGRVPVQVHVAVKRLEPGSQGQTVAPVKVTAHSRAGIPAFGKYAQAHLCVHQEHEAKPQLLFRVEVPPPVTQIGLHLQDVNVFLTVKFVNIVNTASYAEIKRAAFIKATL